ncbi:hypothetical protein Tco_0598436 [Tanacetum coccineum]
MGVWPWGLWRACAWVEWDEATEESWRVDGRICWGLEETGCAVRHARTSSAGGTVGDTGGRGGSATRPTGAAVGPGEVVAIGFAGGLGHRAGGFGERMVAVAGGGREGRGGGGCGGTVAGGGDRERAAQVRCGGGGLCGAASRVEGTASSAGSGWGAWVRGGIPFLLVTDEALCPDSDGQCLSYPPISIPDLFSSSTHLYVPTDKLLQYKGALKILINDYSVLWPNLLQDQKYHMGIDYKQGFLDWLWKVPLDWPNVGLPL